MAEDILKLKHLTLLIVQDLVFINPGLKKGFPNILSNYTALYLSAIQQKFDQIGN
jgi:hypothetical protein